MLPLSRQPFRSTTMKGSRLPIIVSHSPQQPDPGILKLCELHVAMDKPCSMPTAGRTSPMTAVFSFDYKIDEEEWGEKNKPWRYRWPTRSAMKYSGAFSISTLNQLRRRPIGAAAIKKEGKKAAAKRAAKGPDTEDLFS